jgi:nitric oxide reductase NorD protein
MGEPEDLIIDGAYMASRLAREVWRRHTPAAPERGLRLADVRGRIELFLNALFEAPIAVAPTELQAPVSWLARLARPAAEPRLEATAGTDGVRLFLPPVLDSPNETDEAFQVYLLLAVQQAVRLVRGSTSITLAIESNEVRDWFLIADAVAVDDWVVREAGGLVRTLRLARRDALIQRASPSALDDRGRTIDACVRGVLEHDPLERFEQVPVFAQPADALEWATTRVRADRRAYRGVPAVWYWGRARPAAPGLAGASQYDNDRPDAEWMKRRRVAEMRRRPRIREAAEDEDDGGTGTWVIRPDEPQESVEDPLGLQRPTDRADDADPEGLGDSLSELPEARVVRTPGQAREVLRAGDELPPTLREVTPATMGFAVAYPEWDYRSAVYRQPGAIVHETIPPLGGRAWVEGALARHARLVRRVRTRFERLRPRRIRIGRQPDGPELDIAEYVSATADARVGIVGDDRLYVNVRPGRRELSVALLVDVSASTDSWVSGQQRIVDVEKDALLVVCEALAALGDRYAVFAFAGESAEHVAIIPLKGFCNRLDDLVRRRIGALEPDGYTRVGAAIRYATAALSRRSSARRLLLILSDGKPNDVDAYDGPYGIEDARQAVAEARMQNVDVFCLTVDREAPRYAPRIFGRGAFGMLRRPDQLPEALIEVLRRLVGPTR